MRKGQGELDLVRHGFSVSSALERNAEGRGTSPQGRAGKTKRVHLAMGGWREMVIEVTGLRCKTSKSDIRLFPRIHHVIDDPVVETLMQELYYRI